MRPWVLIFAFLAGGAVVPLLVPSSEGSDTVSAAVRDFVTPYNTEETRQRKGSIGESREGRPLLVEDFGEGPIKIYVVGGVHGEPPALRPIDELSAFFRKPSTKRRMTVRMLRDLNPDGTARGLFCNAGQVDIDRNFPSKDFTPSARHGMSPLSEPEAKAFWDDVRSFKPDLVVVLQSALAGPFLDGDGPSDAYGMQFVRGAASADDRWTLLGDQGYAFSGSMGSALGKDRGIPVLNLRVRRDQDADSVREAIIAGFDALGGSYP